MHWDFGSGLSSWTQRTDDTFDWTLLSLATGSSGTGPTSDHTTGAGRVKLSNDICASKFSFVTENRNSTRDCLFGLHL